jgi:predicted dehydrogenase
MTANPTKTRWGIVGTGPMAVEFARGLAMLPDASLVAVGSRSAESARKCAGRLGVARAHGTYDALLADPEIDVVYVATVNTSHRDLCLAALDAGKPVLCEKPFALNAGQAREVVERARSRRLFCMEAMWTRFLPGVVRLKQLLDEGAIGDPRLFSARIGYPFEASPSARHFDPALGGGALLDLGVYPISLAFHLFGRPESVVGKADLASTGVDAGEAILLTHAGGRISVLTASVTSASPNDAVVMGTLGQIRLHEPIVRPERLTITRVTPVPYGGGGGGGGRMAKLKESALVRGVYRRVRPILASLKGGGGTLLLPCLGNGYAHEAEEVMRCLRAGLVESPIMPLDETVAILETMDELRQQWGVKFPGE